MCGKTQGLPSHSALYPSALTVASSPSALTAADKQQTPWPAVLPGSGSKSASGRIAAETTPAGSLQQPGSGLHAGQSAYGGGSTGQRTTPWSHPCAQPQDHSVPRFHEMEVSSSLLLNPSVHYC